MPFPVNPQTNMGHAAWSITTAPAGEADAASKVFWACDACGVIVGFWRAGHGSTPTSDETAPPDDVGAYSGQLCK
jgi:hypothetical protein